MRLRTIKPGYFKNEDLAELPALTRLLFAGLWCMADREGRLEDRPKRIKAELLPYDDGDVDAMLGQLANRGFILRYHADGERYIQVVNFAKHQTPHIKEGASTIPAPPTHGPAPEPPVPHTDEHQTSTVPAPDTHGANTVQAPPVFGDLGIGDLELGSGDLEPEPREAAPPAAAAEVRGANVVTLPTFTDDEQALVDVLSGVLVPRGLVADRQFWRKVLDRYPGLDLEMEAMKIVDWLRLPKNRREVCNQRRVFNWLDKTVAQQAAQPKPVERRSVAEAFGWSVPVETPGQPEPTQTGWTCWACDKGARPPAHAPKCPRRLDGTLEAWYDALPPEQRQDYQLKQERERVSA